MKDFCSSYCLKSVIKQPTCFKNPENPSCINLILTNKSQSFHNTCVVEARLSYFHRMAVSVLKMHFHKLTLKIISYKDFKKFEYESFMDSLYLALNSQNICVRMSWIIKFQEKTSVWIINFSLLKRCLSLSWKKRFLVKDFCKTWQMEID